MLSNARVEGEVKPINLAFAHNFLNVTAIGNKADLLKTYQDDKNAVIVRLVEEAKTTARFGVSRTTLIETGSQLRRVPAGNFDLTIRLGNDGSFREFLGRPDAESGAFIYERPLTEEDVQLGLAAKPEVLRLIYQIDESGLIAGIVGREMAKKSKNKNGLAV